MKILKNNYRQTDVKEDVKRFDPYPRKLICEQCGSELEYEESDLRIGAFGCVYLDCPCCGRDNTLDSHENELTLTVDNVEFPVHFHHTSANLGAIDTCNNTEIKKNIRQAIDYFRKNKEEYVWHTYYGNLLFVVFRYDGDEQYEVLVSNNYYDTYIPFESQDY